MPLLSNLTQSSIPFKLDRHKNVEFPANTLKSSNQDNRYSIYSVLIGCIFRGEGLKLYEQFDNRAARRALSYPLLTNYWT